MSDLPRRMVAQLRRLVGNRRMARRVPVRLDFTLSLEDPRVSRNGSRRVPPLSGHTLDVSTTGLGLVVPAIRIGGYYLAGTERRLFLKLTLPESGPVEIRVIPVRYESLEDDPGESGYIIGAKIEEMSEEHRKRYNQSVAALLKKSG